MAFSCGVAPRVKTSAFAIISGKNYRIVSSRRKGEKSQIVSLEYLADLTSAQIAERLGKENIIVSPRGKRLRIAPHFFNNRVDIERLTEALP
jgi:selenocysteine lyase/cysteine desulfurase